LVIDDKGGRFRGSDGFWLGWLVVGSLWILLDFMDMMKMEYEDGFSWM
jgi:hypothetical protein